MYLHDYNIDLLDFLPQIYIFTKIYKLKTCRHQKKEQGFTVPISFFELKKNLTRIFHGVNKILLLGLCGVFT